MTISESKRRSKPAQTRYIVVDIEDNILLDGRIFTNRTYANTIAYGAYSKGKIPSNYQIRTLHQVLQSQAEKAFVVESMMRLSKFNASKRKPRSNNDKPSPTRYIVVDNNNNVLFDGKEFTARVIAEGYARDKFYRGRFGLMREGKEYRICTVKQMSRHKLS